MHPLHSGRVLRDERVDRLSLSLKGPIAALPRFEVVTRGGESAPPRCCCWELRRQRLFEWRVKVERCCEEISVASANGVLVLEEAATRLTGSGVSTSHTRLAAATAASVMSRVMSREA